MKKLNEIVKCDYDIEVNDVVSNSQDIEKGNLFVATKGMFCDHIDFVDDAINRGCCAVVAEKDIDLSVPAIKVKDVNLEFRNICAKFYNKSNWKFDLVGITGTDGKTTTSTLIYEILRKSSAAFYIGTNGVFGDNIFIPTANTTPCLEKLYKIFNEFNEKKYNLGIMEVSSEGLLHGRVDDIQFKYTILTNISEDHLNIHKTLQNYIDCKASLFQKTKSDGYAIINIDDAYYETVKNNISGNLITYGTSVDASYIIKNVEEKNDGLEFDIANRNNIWHIKTKLLGLYNAYNITAAFIVCYHENIKPDVIIDRIAEIDSIGGRCEMLDFGQKYKLILDYAHTTNGIKNILSSANKLDHNKIITVIGSAGGREVEKRSRIGKAVLELSDHVIFTMDDPRYEDVNKIIDDMVSDTSLNNYERIVDRTLAINKALDIAQDKDIVLILGKGRDNYMAIENRKDKYCDYTVIENYMNNKENA